MIRYWKPFYPLYFLSFICLVSLPAWGAKFQLDAKVVEAFTADGNFTPIPLPNYRRPVGFSAVYKIDYSIITNVAELESDELGFANMGFTIDQTYGVTDAFHLGWTPNTETIDINGPTPGGVVPLFAENLDAGIPGDLRGMLVSINSASAPPPITDARAFIGQNGPQYIGSTFLVWDGFTPAFTSTHGIRANPPMIAEFSALRSDGFIKYGVIQGPSTTIYFGYVPEPTGFALILPTLSASLLCRGGKR